MQNLPTRDDGTRVSEKEGTVETAGGQKKRGPEPSELSKKCESAVLLLLLRKIVYRLIGARASVPLLCHRVETQGGKSPSLRAQESGRFRNQFGTRKKLRSDPDPRTSTRKATISSWSWSVDQHRAGSAGVSTRKKRFTAQKNPTDLKVSPCGTPDCVASSSCCCSSSEFSCAVCGRYAKQQQQQQQLKGTESSSWNSSQGEWSMRNVICVQCGFAFCTGCVSVCAVW